MAVAQRLTREQLQRAELAARLGIEAPDGPRLEEFSARGLAAAIEQEVGRARVVGHTKIALHMDIPDALRLAAALRKRGR